MLHLAGDCRQQLCAVHFIKLKMKVFLGVEEQQEGEGLKIAMRVCGYLALLGSPTLLYSEEETE